MPQQTSASSCRLSWATTALAGTRVRTCLERSTTTRSRSSRTRCRRRSRAHSRRTTDEQQFTGGMSLGDSYRRNPDLQIQYSLRVDASHFTRRPRFQLERRAGVRSAQRSHPERRSCSARASGSRRRLARRTRSRRSPGHLARRVRLRGECRRLREQRELGSARHRDRQHRAADWRTDDQLRGTGGTDSRLGRVCDQPSSIPSTCADGTQGTLFANSAPNVTVIAKNYTPQKSVRGNTSWTGSVLDARFSTRWRSLTR